MMRVLRMASVLIAVAVMSACSDEKNPVAPQTKEVESMVAFRPKGGSIVFFDAAGKAGTTMPFPRHARDSADQRRMNLVQELFKVAMQDPNFRNSKAGEAVAEWNLTGRITPKFAKEQAHTRVDKGSDGNGRHKEDVFLGNRLAARILWPAGTAASSFKLTDGTGMSFVGRRSAMMAMPGDDCDPYTTACQQEVEAAYGPSDPTYDGSTEIAEVYSQLDSVNAMLASVGEDPISINWELNLMAAAIPWQCTDERAALIDTSIVFAGTAATTIVYAAVFKNPFGTFKGVVASAVALGAVNVARLAYDNCLREYGT